MGWASLTPLTVDALNGQRTIGSVLEPGTGIGKAPFNRAALEALQCEPAVM